MTKSAATRRTPADSVPVLTSWRRFTEAMASSPLLVFERPAGQEQEEQDGGQVVDQPAGVDDPAAEFVHVGAQVQIAGHLAGQVGVDQLSDPRDEKQEEEEDRRDHGGHELAPRGGRNERADREEESADQEEAQVSGSDRP